MNPPIKTITTLGFNKKSNMLKKSLTDQ